MRDLLLLPIVGAPLAGGPSTPALAAAVSEAGGLGFVAAGYKTTADVKDDIAAVRAATERPFGVNLFYPTQLDVDGEALAAYAKRLEPEGRRYGVSLGEPRWGDDEWNAKLDLVTDARPAVVSFTFGCPDETTVARLRRAGIRTWCTVTHPDEAQVAAAAGIETLVVQGAEAGGHQASFDDTDAAPLPVLSLLALVRGVTDLPLVASGGIADARGVATVLSAGAVAAQIGTALMLTPEAGTSAAQRAAFAQDGTTRLTRAFTGRRARGIVNRFMRDHDAAAPRAYPQVHNVTAPLRAAAREIGDADGVNLWAGENYRLAERAPAGELVRRWAGAAT